MSEKANNSKLLDLRSKIATLLLYYLGGRVAHIGLPDDKGGNFKEYCFNENMPERVANLKKNLDAESIEVIDECIHKIKYDPQLVRNWDNEVTLINPKSYVPTKDKEIAKEFLRNYKTYKKQYPLPVDTYAPEIFMFHSGLKCLPEVVTKYIANKDTIDGGAYLGDSMLVLQEYNPKKIYSFELSDANSELFRKTMELNNVSPSTVELVTAGLGETDSTIKITDSAQSGTSIYVQGEKSVQLRSVDSFAAEHKLNVGLIKIDIEGSESQAVRGMIQTIKQDKPVLSIAIYHNPYDFFEIKPYLESLDINYKWMVRRIQPSQILHMPLKSESWFLHHINSFFDTVLLGYPAELDDQK
jgi:FkbM family methyltransferase